MKIIQKHWTEGTGWQTLSANGVSEQVQLVLVFGDNTVLRQESRLQEIKQFFPQGRIIGCSTAGEIIGRRVFDNSLTATGVFFENTRLQFAETTLNNMEESFNAGKKLCEALDPNGLSHVFVLSEGLNVNGSELVKGLRSKLPVNVAVTGGLAGDQDRFKETMVLIDNVLRKNAVAVIGFYGDSLRIGYGSKGGWDSFGPDRRVTRSKANILYELDGQAALELYKKYLGEQANGLPATGLLFPLSISLNGGGKRVVRTILSVNENDGSMTFAGDVPEGNCARLMKANFERLVDGAAESAKQSLTLGSPAPDLAILVSCVGRKLVLKQRIDEEIECVQDTLGAGTALTGFYSYGEICPIGPDEKQPELHNQTMTITTFSER
ncbi:MAG: FIST C-terminal domain-containing protein [Phycisphaerae bacterium]|nr:FIST C-terminal domain-containing protein [Phycisphaerae bacterium]MDD5380946.1 FIST C-terminal domain-containing protein [Phycisphaerae bacterium]